MSHRLRAISLLIALVLPRPASALQPLGEFLDAARRQNPDAQAAAARAEAGEATAKAAWRRLWPVLNARASYTRNERESVARVPDGAGGVREATMQAKDQLEGLVSLDVPLVDLSAWRATTAVDAAEAASSARADDVRQSVARAVTRAWHQVVSAEGLRAAALKSAEVADQNLAQAKARVEAGRASELETHRATAELATAQEAQAAAEQLIAVSRRALSSLSGVKPTEGVSPLSVALDEPAPMETFAGQSAPTVPAVIAARHEARQAHAEADAQGAVWLPTLGATLNERYTNASGFSNENTAWSAIVALSWRLDGVTFARADAAEATAAAQAAATRKAETAASDAVHDAWQSVKAQVSRARAARAREESTRLAARLARERFDGGVATQLEAIQADRDAFSAEVSRIQAEAELAFARADLELASGAGGGGP